jgi:hypothetical protein
MTINQALDQLIGKEELSLEQQDLKLSLIDFKMKLGGNTMIKNVSEVENIIEFGNKEGNKEI